MTKKFKWTDRILAAKDFDGLPAPAFDLLEVPRGTMMRYGLDLNAVCSVAITVMAIRVFA